MLCLVVISMSYSEAQGRANRKYREKAYDRIEVQAPKGFREVYRAQAAAHGLSLNAYIISLLERDAAGTVAEQIPAHDRPQTSEPEEKAADSLRF